MSNLIYESTLYHHGIKGQKWGVRRFQNKDGTYTSKGKARRNNDSWYDSNEPKNKFSMGVKRYQNSDGTLTEAGKKRYARDKATNNAKKKDNRIQIDGPDPKRWVREDTDRRKRIFDSSSDLVRQFQRMERESAPKPKRKTFDLSKMSDKELRDAVNRKSLENQYNNLFGSYDSPTVSKGRSVARSILETSGDVLAVGSSVLGIMLAVQTLKEHA